MASGDIASIKVSYVELVPVHPASVPPGAMFLDETNAGKVTIKDTGGGGGAVSDGGGTNYFESAMIAGAAIRSKRPVAKRSDGKVVEADTDDVAAMVEIGFSLAAAAGDGIGLSVLTHGPRLAGALDGLGFTSGEYVYMGETPGEYLDADDVAAFTGNNDVIRIVGVADCPVGTASGTATDLIAIQRTIVEP